MQPIKGAAKRRPFFEVFPENDEVTIDAGINKERKTDYVP